MAYGDQGLCFVNPVVCIGNIDRQDKQDKKRLRAMLTGSMIGCAFEVIHEPGSEFLESATEKAMMMGLSEARLSVQSHNPVIRRQGPLSGEAGWRQTILFILSIDVN